MSAPMLPALLHLCDSLFPIGGYAHSDGLEAATDAGLVLDADDLGTWITTLLDETLARVEGPVVARVVHASRGAQWGEVCALDDEVHAMRPSSTAREASRGVGARLLKTWGALYPPSPPIRALLESERRWTLPVAFAVAASSIGADARTAVEAYMYTRLASATSSALRLMRLGQLEAHRTLAESLGRVPGVVETLLVRYERPSSFAPLLDIAAMRQQYVTTRLFRS